VFGGEMVKFCKNGSVATTAAVKLSRAYTGRAKVLVPYEHPFFSYDDWFIGSTAADGGILDEAKQNTHRFHYNDLASIEALFNQYGPDIACVMLEPVKVDAPKPGFLEGIRDLCRRNGSVFILDETIAGLKWSIRGGSGFFNIEPDLHIWGKGIANGFSCCALAGRRDIMALGGSNPTGRRVFLVSTTHGAESGGLAAMMATLDVFLRTDVIGDNWRRGTALMEGIQRATAAHGLAPNFGIFGYPCLPAFSWRGLPVPRLLEWHTLLMQELTKEGQLSQGPMLPTISHDDEIIAQTVAAFDAALARVRRAWDTGSVAGFLEGPAIKPVFRSFQECIKGRCGRLHADEPEESCC